MRQTKTGLIPHEASESNCHEMNISKH